ncbi:uncharacterized protein BXZ73DRAFT_106651 [Epithele typhae]|uniref:uncharacterized protein n=1 Tax=Epithele typhae TaxID=378194 RepID=UPI0020075277|nr:uncharacterized protein BXZ73DRAFT_106651 [Epithele typhae]KAH9914153.1 hypothetical protein BXZ73DRAFT_106651 [Epithele typhae]
MQPLFARTQLMMPDAFVYILDGMRPTREALGHDADDVVAAKWFGSHGILLADFKAARRELQNLISDPVKHGWEYLCANAGKLACDADRPGVSIMENFGQLLILEATGDRSPNGTGTTSKAGASSVLTHENFSDDLDTTSLGLVTMKPPKEHVHSIMDEMLTLLSDDGLPYTYFDRECPRLDPVVAVNVLHLFYTHGRGCELPGMLASVHRMLLHREWWVPNGRECGHRDTLDNFTELHVMDASGHKHDLDRTVRVEFFKGVERMVMLCRWAGCELNEKDRFIDKDNFLRHVKDTRPQDGATSSPTSATILWRKIPAQLTDYNPPQFCTSGANPTQCYAARAQSEHGIV